jgi:thioredoxin 1
METKGMISRYRNVALVIIMIAVVALFILGRKRDITSINPVRDTVDLVEKPASDFKNNMLPEDMSVQAVPPDTMPGIKVKDTLSVAAANPLEKAFSKGLPVIADFGRGTCIPCKMMQPILEKLERDFKGKVSVLILDIREYSSLSQKYRITLIPTQIFFDASGEEVFRHRGFMPEEDIVSQLKKMGVE